MISYGKVIYVTETSLAVNIFNYKITEQKSESVSIINERREEEIGRKYCNWSFTVHTRVFNLVTSYILYLRVTK